MLLSVPSCYAFGPVAIDIVMVPSNSCAHNERYSMLPKMNWTVGLDVPVYTTLNHPVAVTEQPTRLKLDLKTTW